MKDCGVFEKGIFTMNGFEAVKSAKERIEECLAWSSPS